MDDIAMQITAFLQEWLIIPPDYLQPSGYVKTGRIGACIGYLLEQGVFDDADEFRRELMREYGVILPAWAYEGAKSGTP